MGARKQSGKRGKKKPEALTPRQQAFVDHYLVSLNGTQAAREAGYAEGSASVQASRLLAIAKIQESIAAGMKARGERLDLTKDRVLLEIARVAFLDPGAAFDEAGVLRRVPDMPEDVRRALAGYDVEELFEGSGEERTQVGTTRKVKFLNKVEALKLAAQHLGLLEKTQHIQVTGAGGGPVQAQVEHVIAEPESIAAVLSVLGRVGALAAIGGAAGAGQGADAQADAVHPAPSAPDATGVPPPQ